jgi:hypothetical protein
LKDFSIDERIILKLIANKSTMMVWTGFNWLRIRHNDGLLNTAMNLLVS